MSIFRTYFNVNSTLVKNVLSNNSRNPVTEISYGTVNKQVSRYIFNFSLSELLAKISSGLINPSRITKHVLRMTNTIRYAPEHVGGKSYSSEIDRASGFGLELFNINESWDEGNGYDFIYNDRTYPQQPSQASNWLERKTGVNWTVSGGSYVSGITTIIGTQLFDNGNEDIDIDVTDYVNQRLYNSGNTYSGTSYGLGLKMFDVYEAMITEFRQAVAFHGKNTNTFYEPFIETTIDDTIVDDRNYFYMDKYNDLYLYPTVGNFPSNVTINNVKIYDYKDQLVATITGSSIVNVSKGVYKITLKVDSNLYPDAVIFKDEWSITNNNISTTFVNQFYLISSDKYYTFNQANIIDFRNYYFYFWGIQEKEKVSAGVLKKIKLTIRELYANQNNFVPLDIEYRIFTSIANGYEIDVIPFTPIDRTSMGYQFNIDTSWLIPQDYKLQIRMKNGDYYENKQTLSFSVVSNGIVK